MGSLSKYLFGFFIIYFIFLAFNPSLKGVGELDSITYHLPLAQNFAQGNFVDLWNIAQGLGFYPAIGETILSFFVFTNLPIGLFNVLALLILFFVAKNLAKTFRLDKESQSVFALSVSIIPTFIRLVYAQTIDIWLAIFFVLVLNTLCRVKNEDSWFAKLGIWSGFLCGVKFSGFLYLLVLLLLFAKNYIQKITLKRMFLFLIPFIIFGVSWYIRNYFVTGNPFYPVGLFGFKGNQYFHTSGWFIFKTIFVYQGGLWLMIQAFISEYLLWFLAPFAVITLFIKSKWSKQEIGINNLGKLVITSILCFLIYLPQPSGETWQVIVSNIRFTYPMMLPLILAVFLIAQKYNFLIKLNILAILNMAGILPMLNYYPKLTFVFLAATVLFLFK